MPADDSEDLYKNDHLLHYSPRATIKCGLDYMLIQTADHSHAGRYKLVSKNSAGKGQITFRLKVKCKYIVHREINGK